MPITSAKQTLIDEVRSLGAFFLAPVSLGYSSKHAEMPEAQSNSLTCQPTLLASPIQPPLALEIASPLSTTSRNKVAFVDLDHTISDAFWRDHLIKSEMSQSAWRHYHSEATYDDVIYATRDLVRALYAYDFEIIILTARYEEHRRAAEYWLTKWDVPFHVLIMRPTANLESASVLKLRQARNYLDDTEGDKSVIIVDDNEAVCEAFCAAGATVLRAQVHKRKDCRKFTREG